MKSDPRKREGLPRKTKLIRSRVVETEKTPAAIRSGDVEALVIQKPGGDQIGSLKGADRLYRLFVEKMSQGAVTTTPDGIILFGNARFSEMIETPLKTVIGSPVQTFVADSHQRPLLALLKKSRKEDCQAEILLRKGNSPVSALVSASSLSMEDGDVICLVFTDLAERKREDDILKAERLARAILEQSAEVIVVCNQAGVITHASEEAHSIVPEPVISRPFDEVFRLTFSEPPSKFSISRVLEGGIFRNAEVTLERNGRNFLFLLNARCLLDKGNQSLGCVVTFTDIHKR